MWSSQKLFSVEMDYNLAIEDRPKSPKQVELKITAQVDAKMPSKPRAFFISSDLVSFRKILTSVYFFI